MPVCVLSTVVHPLYSVLWSRTCFLTVADTKIVSRSQCSVVVRFHFVLPCSAGSLSCGVILFDSKTF